MKELSSGSQRNLDSIQLLDRSTPPRFVKRTRKQIERRNLYIVWKLFINPTRGKLGGDWKETRKGAGYAEVAGARETGPSKVRRGSGYSAFS